MCFISEKLTIRGCNLLEKFSFRRWMLGEEREKGDDKNAKGKLVESIFVDRF